MRSLLDKYRAYRLRRFLRAWSKRRQKGKTRYILMTALGWSVSISTVLIIGAYLTDGTVDIIMSAIRFFLLFLAGLLIGRLSWRSGETVFLASEKYKNDVES